MEVLYDDNTYISDLKVSPNYKYLSWLEIDEQAEAKISFFDLSSGKIQYNPHNPSDYEWSPDGTKILMLIPDCSNICNEPTSQIGLIATCPGLFSYMIKTIEIETNEVVQHTCGTFPGEVNLYLSIGWFDESTIWYQEDSGVTVMDLKSGSITNKIKTDRAYSYSPFDNGLVVEIDLTNQDNYEYTFTKVDKTLTQLSSLIKIRSESLGNRYQQGMGIDSFNNLYYFNDRNLIQMQLNTLTETTIIELSLLANSPNSSDLPLYPSATTSNQVAILSDSTLYLCESGKCISENLNLNEHQYASDLLIIPRQFLK
jgi:hypothetical protein